VVSPDYSELERFALSLYIFYGATENARPDIARPSKLWGLSRLTSRDWTTRHHIARVDSPGAVSVFEWMLTASLCLIQGVLYELLIGAMFVSRSFCFS